MSRLARHLSSVSACALVLGAPAEGEHPLTTVLVATVDFPVFVTHAPGDTARLFVLEKSGRIAIVDNGEVLETPFLDISGLVREDHQERGLLGLAFHPEYQDNGFFYVNYTGQPSGDTVVARYQVSADPDIADPASGQIVVTVETQFVTHNAGWMGFGPNDAYLYIAVGDGGGGSDPGDDAQDLDALLGKILRVDVNCDDFPRDADRNYGIPPDNPFVGAKGADEIWSYGLRNPWRCSFDRATGDLYIADVGQSSWEEVSFQPAGSTGGENYGWDCKEANACTDEDTCACSDPGLINPLFAYPHPNGPSAIIGGYVYRGTAIPDLRGAYFFADTMGRIWSLRHDGGEITALIERQDELAPGDDLSISRPTSFGEDDRGELYICDRSGSEIYKVVPACPWDQDRTGDVGVTDLLALLAAWGSDPGGPPDFDGDGNVGVADLVALLGNWGPC